MSVLDPPVPLLDLLGPALLNRSDRWICLLDGGSGSGKTTCARQLVDWLCAHDRPAQVVSLDDCYPGWEGLAEGSTMVWRDILGRGGFRRWDWAADRPGDWVQLPTGTDLVIEGCGAITEQAVRLADFSVWLEMPAAVRRARALARDGAAYAPHWERWAAQEARHRELDQPRARADLLCELDPEQSAPANRRNPGARDAGSDRLTP